MEEKSNGFSWREFIGGVLLASLLWGTVVLFLRFWRRPGEELTSIVLEPPPVTATPEPSATPPPMRVYVSGAVANSGVYSLSQGSIALDAVEAAGGFLPEADRDGLNLAEPLRDGAEIHVPRLGETTPTPEKRGHTVKTPTPTVSWPIDINTAMEGELEALPRVGPSLAEKIIEGRPYHSIEDIMKVPGIGQKTFAQIKDLIEVKP